jgi:hypothetical protein
VKALLQPLYTQGRLSKAEFVRICKIGVQHVVTSGSKNGLETILWRELAGSALTRSNVGSTSPRLLQSPPRNFEMPVKEAEALAAKRRKETLSAREAIGNALRQDPAVPSANTEDLLEQILRQLQRPWASPSRSQPSYHPHNMTTLARIDTEEFLERQELLCAESQSRCEAMRLYVGERLRLEYCPPAPSTTAFVRGSHNRASTPPPSQPVTPRDKLRILQTQNDRITNLFTEMKKKEKELEEKKRNQANNNSGNGQQPSQLAVRSSNLSSSTEYPPRAEVIECVRSILQPLHDGRQIPPDVFVNVVKSVSSQFFQTRYREGDDWRSELRTLVMRAVQK